METRIPLLDIEEQRQLFGPYDRHVKELDRRFGVRMSARNGSLRLRGGDDQLSTIAARVEDILADIRSSEMEPPPAEIEARLLGDVASSKKTSEASPREKGSRSGSRMPEARSDAQAEYLQAMRDSDLVLASGPAGTGKTFLAVAAAVRHLQAGRVSRLVLTRPAIEAGEHLGFLPGDYEAKVDPYLRPLYDALRDILGPTGFRRLKSLDLLEIAPLAFMRGRTLARSFIILDEAQNCTPGQMKMFLTRIGEGSKAVVSGDLTQTDLPGGVSGLTDAVGRLRGVSGVSIVQLGACDIQRSGLVQRVVEAYEDE